MVMASEGEDTWEYAKEIADALGDGGAKWAVKGPLSADPKIPVVDIQLSICACLLPASNSAFPFQTLIGTMEFVGMRVRKGLILDSHITCPNIAVLWIGGKGTIDPDMLPPFGLGATARIIDCKDS